MKQSQSQDEPAQTWDEILDGSISIQTGARLGTDQARSQAEPAARWGEIGDEMNTTSSRDHKNVRRKNNGTMYGMNVRERWLGMYLQNDLLVRTLCTNIVGRRWKKIRRPKAGTSHHSRARIPRTQTSRRRTVKIRKATSHRWSVNRTDEKCKSAAGGTIRIASSIPIHR